MCTVSWLRQAEGYVLLSNRDERHTRKPASGPRVGNSRGVSFVAPVDGDYGGSWIGANQFGLTLCLLNRYVDHRGARLGTADESADPDRDYASRGLLLSDLLDCRHCEDASERLNDIDLSRFRPFTLLALSSDHTPILIDWNGAERSIEIDAEARMPLTSSSFQGPNVTTVRRNVFAEMVSQRGRVDTALLHQFHRSHLHERGPYSVCMHRDDAATVSLSIVTVTKDAVEFVYHPNSPCLKAVEEKVHINRTAVRSQAAAL